MSQLVIAVGTAEFVLTADELDKHPDSLLSSLMNDTITKTGFEAPQGKASQEPVASTGTFWTFCVWVWSVFAIPWANCWSSAEPAVQQPLTDQCQWLSAVEGGWRLNLETMNIPIKNKLQVLDLAAAAELLHAAYRQDFIPEDVWEPLLFRRRAATTQPSGGTSAQYEYDNSLHADVSKVLDYFSLPGPVTRWLPPQQSLSVGRGRLLGFVHTCHIIKQVEEVVDAMLAYKPQQEQDELTHAAIFVVCINDKDVQPKSNLRVYVLQHVPRSTLNILGRDLEGKLASKPAAPMGGAIAVPLTADGSKAGDGITWQQLDAATTTGCGTVYSLDKEGLALKSAIQARLKGTGVDLFLRSMGGVHMWVLAW